MRIRTSIASPVSGTLRRRPRMACGRHAEWGIRRIRRNWVSMPLPTMEEVEERLRGYRGFFASLTPEQVAILESLDEFGAICGDPNGPKRTW
jgi:hypothetical protein